MTSTEVEAPHPPSSVGRVQRVVGRVHGARPGPTLICVGGLHGNEPAGVLALGRVLGVLQERASDLVGDFVGLAGNLAALEARSRFIDRDLNRAWTDARVEELRRNTSMREVEDREQVALLDEIGRAVSEARGPLYALDLHTTSGDGGIFSAFGDALHHRAFAAQFPIPMILGLEELVDGTLVNFLGEHGLVAVTVETGQHDEAAAVDRAEAAIWVAIEAAGLLPPQNVPEAAASKRMLRDVTRSLPRALEMRYRHPVEDDDGFEMARGYFNFQHVDEGEVVASDRNGQIAAVERSRLLMPLYQKQGEDGFFLVREFSSFWMTCSALLRTAGVDRLAPMLPGVRRVPGSRDAVIVHKRIARFFAKQLFHLLGFRQLEDIGSSLVMRRRPQKSRELPWPGDRAGG